MTVKILAYLTYLFGKIKQSIKYGRPIHTTGYYNDDGKFHELLQGWGIKIRNKSLKNIFITVHTEARIFIIWTIIILCYGPEKLFLSDLNRNLAQY